MLKNETLFKKTNNDSSFQDLVAHTNIATNQNQIQDDIIWADLGDIDPDFDPWAFDAASATPPAPALIDDHQFYRDSCEPPATPSASPEPQERAPKRAHRDATVPTAKRRRAYARLELLRDLHDRAREAKRQGSVCPFNPATNVVLYPMEGGRKDEIDGRRAVNFVAALVRPRASGMLEVLEEAPCKWDLSKECPKPQLSCDVPLARCKSATTSSGEVRKERIRKQNRVYCAAGKHVLCSHCANECSSCPQCAA